MEEIHLYNKGFRMKFVKAGIVSKGFCFTSSDYDSSQNRTKIFEIRSYVLHYQKMFAIHEFGGEKKTMISFVLIRDEIEKEKEI